MTGAMYAAVAGLRAHMSALNVIGQNISNVNTNAYKSTRYTFLEALYSTVRGGSNGSALLGGKNPAQMGYGSSIGTIDLDMSTKNYTPTGRAMDVMIDGDGFLLVGNKGMTFTNEEDLKGLFLTRLGNLDFDPNGYLVDGQGNVVYGFMSVENPEYRDAIDADKAATDPAAPEKITQLPEDLAAAFQAAPDKYYWDKDGQLVQIVSDGGNPAKYSTKVIDQYTPHPVLTEIRLPMAATGAETQPVLDANGQPVNPPQFTSLYKKGEAVYPKYDPITGTIVDATADADVSSARIEPDSISIDENTGRITCTAAGKAVVIGTIAIGRVTNPNGVTHVDGHYYQALEGAGRLSLNAIGSSVLPSTDPDSPFYDPNQTGALAGEIPIGTPGTTKLLSGGLESSGTDLATEVSNMIMIQRGYQANTRIVTVTDSMLEELVNMKR